MTQTKTYDESSIRELQGLEAVRMRPGMYIGGTDNKAFHHCLWEIVDNSVDEALEGHCSEINVVIHSDGSASVQDNGRGIPTGISKQKGIPVVTMVFTSLHAGGKFDGDSYKYSGGLHGVGASVTNALSEKLIVLVKRDGKKHQQTFEQGGNPVSDLEVIGTTNRTGTYVRYWPDHTIFDKDCSFDQQTIADRLKTTAYLNPGLKLTLKVEGSEEVHEYLADSFSEILDDQASRSGSAMCKTIEGKASEDVEGEGVINVVIAMRWHEKNGYILGFANNIPTHEGFHITGLRTASTRAVNNHAQANNLVKKGQTFTAEDVQSSLIAAVSVQVPEPKFSGQTKEKLTNDGVQGIVSRAAQAALQQAFEMYPDQAKRIIERAKLAQKAREAADRARDQVVERKSAISPTSLPGKLADCQEKDPTRSEVFMVEGDSAGGSAKQGRDREYQAILPLKGKILNTFRSKPQKVMSSEEVKNIILALGAGSRSNYNPDKLRYHKIIVLADADSDGAHIACLTLTFMHTNMRQAIEDGHVYVAIPPLYRVRKKKEAMYLKDDRELQAFLASKPDPDSWQVQRFKGLGEMNPDQLWEAAMDPLTRRIGQVRYSEDRESDEAVFELLMGDKVPPRREFIESRAEYATVDL